MLPTTTTATLTTAPASANKSQRARERERDRERELVRQIAIIPETCSPRCLPRNETPRSVANCLAHQYDSVCLVMQCMSCAGLTKPHKPPSQLNDLALDSCMSGVCQPDQST